MSFPAYLMSLGFCVYSLQLRFFFLLFFFANQLSRQGSFAWLFIEERAITTPSKREAVIEKWMRHTGHPLFLLLLLLLLNDDSFR